MDENKIYERVNIYIKRLHEISDLLIRNGIDDDALLKGTNIAFKKNSISSINLISGKFNYIILDKNKHKFVSKNYFIEIPQDVERFNGTFKLKTFKKIYTRSGTKYVIGAEPSEDIVREIALEAYLFNTIIPENSKEADKILTPLQKIKLEFIKKNISDERGYYTEECRLKSLFMKEYYNKTGSWLKP
ncbi:MAG: hypothetical protein AB7V77_03385 [Candidatus Woesearchaeota archaeon]